MHLVEIIDGVRDITGKGCKEQEKHDYDVP